MTHNKCTSLSEAFPEPTRADVEDAVSRLVEDFDPLRIVVFGSFARGEARPGSDLDFLVVLPTVENKREAALAMRRTLADCAAGSDVIVTTPDEIERRGWIIGTVLREALQEGHTVYESTEGA
jgi:predicted nucleotidyltransferase